MKRELTGTALKAKVKHRRIMDRRAYSQDTEVASTHG
jgi:hypothetical protein